LFVKTLTRNKESPLGHDDDNYYRYDILVSECRLLLSEIREKPLKIWFWLIIKYQKE
jgi:hypothetical protein